MWPRIRRPRLQYTQLTGQSATALLAVYFIPDIILTVFELKIEHLSEVILPLEVQHRCKVIAIFWRKHIEVL